jgi:hypothetical protein
VALCAAEARAMWALAALACEPRVCISSVVEIAFMGVFSHFWLA